MMFHTCDPKLREEFNAREKALKDKTTELETAEAKGIEKGVEIGLEKGREEGVEIELEKGEEIGLEKGLIKSIRSLAKNGFTKEFILENLNCTAETYEKAMSNGEN